MSKSVDRAEEPAKDMEWIEKHGGPPLPLATNAMRDLIELTILSKDVPAAANALKEHFEFSIPVLTIDIEGDSAMVAWELVIHFKPNETLMAHLSALRAEKREYADTVRVGIAHGVIPQ